MIITHSHSQPSQANVRLYEEFPLEPSKENVRLYEEFPLEPSKENVRVFEGFYVIYKV